MTPSPVRLPDAATLNAVLARLDPASVDAGLAPALAAAFPGFDFNLAQVDDEYWRDTRTVIQPDGTPPRYGTPRRRIPAFLAWGGTAPIDGAVTSGG